MASNSGCTVVLVDGATTPNFLRKPRESVMGKGSSAVGGGSVAGRRARRQAHSRYDRRKRGNWIMLRNGKEHLESLRDGRVVYVGGERIDDVTRHPAFRGAAETVAAIYDMKADPANRAVMSYEEDGGRHSIYFL